VAYSRSVSLSFQGAAADGQDGAFFAGIAGLIWATAQGPMRELSLDRITRITVIAAYFGLLGGLFGLVCYVLIHA